MNYAQKMKFLEWLLLKQNPQMLVKPCISGGFYMIPFKTLERIAYDKDAIGNT